MKKTCHLIKVLFGIKGCIKSGALKKKRIGDRNKKLVRLKV